MLCVGMVLKISNVSIHVRSTVLQKLDDTVSLLRLPAPLRRFGEGLLDGPVLLLDTIASGLVNPLQFPSLIVQFLTSALPLLG
jgi:hypothetical protein